jgi:hypothetical protein
MHHSFFRRECGRCAESSQKASDPLTSAPSS